MLLNTDSFKNGLILSLCIALTACGGDDNTKKSAGNAVKQETKTISTQPSPDTLIDPIIGEDPVVTEEKSKENLAPLKAEEIGWDKLIPDSYNPDEIIGKYMEKLEKLEDGDKEAMELYGKIQAELDNAPVNKSLDGKIIKMPGFIAPLENENGVISEFLLVPYFGACIHSPPPPMNQTVMIKAGKGQGVKSEDSSLPVWITGKLKAVEERTNIGAAGYRIENAEVELYEED